MQNLFVAVIAAIIVIFTLLVFALVGSIPLYFLWNWLMPALFGLKVITWVQAMGLVFLTSILFKSSSSSCNCK